MKKAAAWIHPILAAVLCVGSCRAASPATETPRADTPPAASTWTSDTLQSFILDAYHRGDKKVVIPPGTYRLKASDTNEVGCLSFDGLKDFEIDATGSLFIGMDLTRRIVFFHDCDGVTLRGGTYCNAPVLFSQGRIEAIGVDRQSLDIRIAKGYPADLDNPLHFFSNGEFMFINLFDPRTREWKRDTGDVKFTSLERLGFDLFRFHLRETLPQDYPIALGDLAAWRGHGKGAILLHYCQRMKMIGMTIESAGGVCMHEMFGEGGNYYSYQVMRGPAPEGADDPPLFSSNADGFHSSNMRHGPTLEKCSFEYMDDDGVAIHGSGALVMEGKGNLVVVAVRCQEPGLLFRAGDTLRFYDKRGVLAGEAKVTSWAPAENYVPAQAPPKDFRILAKDESEGHLTYAMVTLDREISASFPWITVDADALGNGFVIRDCSVRHNRERGMLLKSGEGLVENCLVEGSTLGGIVLMPETCYWNEADYSRHVVIRNNVIRSVGIWAAPFGALNISEVRPGEGFVPFPGGHRDVVVESNAFQDDDGVNVLVSSAQNLLFHNNRFIGPMRREKKVWAQNAAASDALYWITESANVTIEDNQISNPGPFMKATLKTTETAREVREKPVSAPAPAE